MDESEQSGIDRIAEIAGGPGARFESAETPQTPEMLREFVDEDFFGCVRRLMLVAKSSAEVVKFSGIFAGNHQLLRVKAVAERILRGAQFAFGGAGSGGVLSISSIGFGAAAGCLGLCFALRSGGRCGLFFRSHGG